MIKSTVAGLVCLCTASLALDVNSMPLVEGDIYTSDSFSNTINHYSSSGSYFDSFTLDSTYGSGLKGIDFGANGLLYVVSITSGGFGVTTIDNSGVAVTIASGSDYVRGNLSYGKIDVADDGSFYVAGQNNLTAFAPGHSIGKVIYSANQIYDVEIMPSGNLLVLSAYELKEITPSGAVVRNLSTSIRLVDARGLEYDPKTNSIYVTMLGYSGQFFRLMKIDGDTGEVVRNEGFWYGDDLFLTSLGTLLVGSRTQSPGVFDENLHQLGSLEGPDRMFVTQMVSSVPEPAMVVLFGTTLIGLVGIRRKR